MRTSGPSLRSCLTALLMIAFAYGFACPLHAMAEERHASPPGTPEPAERDGNRGEAHATGFVKPPIRVPRLKRSIPIQEAASLPSRFDWREYGKVTPVRNQSSCGSCYAFAAIASIDHRPVGIGRIGPITKKLRDLYFNIVRGQVPKYRHWCTPVYGSSAQLSSAEHPAGVTVGAS